MYVKLSDDELTVISVYTSPHDDAIEIKPTDDRYAEFYYSLSELFRSGLPDPLP